MQVGSLYVDNRTNQGAIWQERERHNETMLGVATSDRAWLFQHLGRFAFHSWQASPSMTPAQFEGVFAIVKVGLDARNAKELANEKATFELIAAR